MNSWTNFLRRERVHFTKVLLQTECEENNYKHDCCSTTINIVVGSWDGDRNVDVSTLEIH